MTSTNERAESLMGRRSGGFPIDQPCELGFRCPVCLVPAMDHDGEPNDLLQWSEYNGFLWCPECDKDYPSALCIDLSGSVVKNKPWVNSGIDDAIQVFLDTTEGAIFNHEKETHE